MNKEYQVNHNETQIEYLWDKTLIYIEKHQIKSLNDWFIYLKERRDGEGFGDHQEVTLWSSQDYPYEIPETGSPYINNYILK